MSKTFHVDPDNPSAEVVNLAGMRLRDGGVVIIPTETVYGLVALSSGPKCYGSTELAEIKKRPVGVPIQLLVENEDALDTHGVDVPEYAHKLAKAFWPGPLTLVVKANDSVAPEFQNAADGSVGLRCPASELVREIIIAAGGPLLATSANIHGKPAPNSHDEIDPLIAESADLIIDGGSTEHGMHSTVVNCMGEEPVIQREGALSEEQIRAALAE